MTEKATKTTIYQKLAAVGKAIDVIPKSGHNKQQNYDYATEADFKKAVRKPFFEQGLALIPRTVSRENYDVTTTSGTVMHYTDIVVEYNIYDGETGESVTGIGYGTGSDSGDKAIWKAYAGALKYFLGQMFMIPTGDDPEDDSKDFENGNRPQQQYQQRQTAPAGSAMSTPAQQKKIHIEAENKGYDIHGLIRERYGVNSTKELTKQQASEVIEWLINAPPYNPEVIPDEEPPF